MTDSVMRNWLRRARPEPEDPGPNEVEGVIVITPLDSTDGGISEVHLTLDRPVEPRIGTEYTVRVVKIVRRQVEE